MPKFHNYKMKRKNLTLNILPISQAQSKEQKQTIRKINSVCKVSTERSFLVNYPKERV